MLLSLLFIFFYTFNFSYKQELEKEKLNSHLMQWMQIYQIIFWQIEE